MNDATRRKSFCPRYEKAAAPDRANPCRPMQARDADRLRGRTADASYPADCSPRKPRAPLNDDQRGLTMRYLPLAQALAVRMARSRPSARDEFESAAFLALVEAAQAFDPSRSVNFTTFARYRIRGALMDLQRDLFAEGRRGKTDDLPKFQPLEPDSEERGKVVGVQVEEPVGAELETAEAVESWLNKLPSLHSTAFRHIYFDGKTHEQAAALVGCSKASMSRIHNETLAWLHQTGGPKTSARPTETVPLNRRRQLQAAWSSRSQAQPRPVFGVAS